MRGSHTCGKAHRVLKRWVERAMFDLQDIFGTRADGKSDTMSVLWSPLESAEDQHIKGALEQLNPVAVRFAIHHRI